MRQLLFIFLFFSCCRLTAQKPVEKKLPFETLTIDDGLSQGMVTSILQDDLGFMWFGTKDGLNRYDGYRFVVYRHNAANKNSLADNYITNIFEDSKGRLWVGTATQGLDLFNRETETFTHFTNEPGNKQSVCSNTIFSLHEDKDGEIYVCTKKGICKIETTKSNSGRNNILFSTIDSIANNTRIISPHKGLFWEVSNSNDIYRSEKDKKGGMLKEKIPFEKFHINNYNNKTNCTVHSLLYDSLRHCIYMLMSDGITKYDEKTGQFENITKKDFRTRLVIDPVILDSAGIIWFTDYGILRQFDLQNFTDYIVATDDAKKQAMISNGHSLYRDRSGNIWIGTKGYGLLKYNTIAEKFHHTDNASIRWMAAGNDNNVLLVKSWNVADVYNKKIAAYTIRIPDTTLQHFNFINKGSVNGLLQDDDGSYWTAFDDLMNYNDVKKKNEEFALHEISPTFPIYSDANGLVWIGKDNALMCFNKRTKKIINYPFPVKTNNEPYRFVQAIMQQSDSIYWIGTINGLFRFNNKNNEWIQHKNNPAENSTLSFDLIFSLCPDPLYPQKYLWIGTNGGGLNRFEYATEKFLRFTTKDGLPNDVIYGILSDDDGNLWMSTNKGLSEFTLNSKRNAGIFTNYEAKDGLQSNEFNRNAFCKTEDGTLFFGGINGFNYFNPRSLKRNSVAPNIVITDFKIGNKPVIINGENSILKKSVVYTKEITLNYEDNMISFEFAAMDFTQPEKNLYQYHLENFDKEWIQSGTSHTATYTNLDPGTYTFRVKGSNSDGVWNETGTAMQLIILPPWYMTWWFRILIGIIIIAAAYSFYRYRLQQALNMQAVRNRIASDLHDEIGSNLSNISIFSKVAQEKTTTENEPLLKMISEYTQVSMDAMSDIVWMINSRNDRFENIFTRMRSLAAEIFEAQNSTLHIQFDEKLNDIKLNMEKRKNLYLIYKEAVNNIAKYAVCKDVWIEMKLSHSTVLMNIADNGKGFDVAKAKKGNGLFNMQKRAEMLNGKLSINSNIGEGSSVQLSFEV